MSFFSSRLDVKSKLSGQSKRLRPKLSVSVISIAFYKSRRTRSTQTTSSKTELNFFNFAGLELKGFWIFSWKQFGGCVGAMFYVPSGKFSHKKFLDKRQYFSYHFPFVKEIVRTVDKSFRQRCQNCSNLHSTCPKG